MLTFPAMWHGGEWRWRGGGGGRRRQRGMSWLPLERESGAEEKSVYFSVGVV